MGTRLARAMRFRRTRPPSCSNRAAPPRCWSSTCRATSRARLVKSRPFMFDFVQKHRRVLQVFLALIAITFATWGIESYTRYAGGRDTVASVNGSDISRREVDEQLRAQQESINRMFRGQIDTAAFDNPETRRAVLDQMVAERLVATETAKR